MPPIALIALVIAAAGTGAADGAQAGISLSVEGAVHEKEPLYASWRIENRSDRSMRLNLGRDLKENLLFVMAAPNAQRLPLSLRFGEGISAIAHIVVKPGSSYSQRVLLNEWYQDWVARRHVIASHLADGALSFDDGSVPTTEPGILEVDIQPRDPRALAALCERLTEASAGPGSAATEAAWALSFVADPVAVPYLKEVIDSGRSTTKQTMAIRGLGRIATEEAIVTLAELVERVPPRDFRSLIRLAAEGSSADDKEVALRAAASWELARILRTTSDPGLRERIEQALQ